MTPSDWTSYVRGLMALTHGAPAQRLDRARRFIDERFAEPITLPQMSKQAHYSPFHFSRAFSAAFGMPPQAYLTRCRMDAARELLAETELSVTEICMAVGYSSLGTFSTRFRRHFGVSPSGMRRVVVPSAGIPVVAVPGCFFRRLSQI